MARDHGSSQQVIQTYAIIEECKVSMKRIFTGIFHSNQQFNGDGQSNGSQMLKQYQEDHGVFQHRETLHSKNKNKNGSNIRSHRIKSPTTQSKISPLPNLRDVDETVEIKRDERSNGWFWKAIRKTKSTNDDDSDTTSVSGSSTTHHNRNQTGKQFGLEPLEEWNVDFPPPATFLPAIVGPRRRSRTSSFGSDSDADATASLRQELADTSDLIHNKYRVLDGLGIGGYGVVVKVEDCSTYPRNVYAMKVIPKKRMLMKRTHRIQLELEIETISSLNSPFLIKGHDTFETEMNTFFILEIVKGGDLFHHLKKCVLKRGDGHAPLTHCEACTILAELFLGLEHMHARGFLHRDIKIENIMLGTDGHVKLIDFGLSTRIIDQIQPLSRAGSLIYMSPELLKDKLGGRHTDWWAYGIVAYELFTGYSPWSSLTDKTTIAREILTVPVTAPSFLWGTPAEEFISSLLAFDYKQRSGTECDEQIKQLDYFNGVDWEKMAKLKYPPAFGILEEVDCSSKEQRLVARQHYEELMKG